jgi:hypothetical protein
MENNNKRWSLKELEEKVKITSYCYKKRGNFWYLTLRVRFPNKSNMALRAAKFVVLTKYKLDKASNCKISAIEVSTRGKKLFYCNFDFCSDLRETFKEPLAVLKQDNVKCQKKKISQV